MKNVDGETSRDSGLLSDPLSFVRSGEFTWSRGALSIRNANGIYWTLLSRNTVGSDGLDFFNTYLYLYPQFAYYHGNGFAVREPKQKITKYDIINLWAL